MFKSKYILRRFGEADRNGYRSYTDRVIRLNVQSLNAKELVALPEGQRSSRRVKSFGRDEVHTVNQRTGIPADLLYCCGDGTSASRRPFGHIPRWHTGNASGLSCRKASSPTRRR